MPELPEVEVTRLGIAPHLTGQTVTAITLRHSGLRWPFPENLAHILCGQVIREVSRRGKYLLLGFDHGTLILHLGMSGHLRVLPRATPAQLHDHFDLEINEYVLRLRDPRRFGAVLWHANEAGSVQQHALLQTLGVEPFQPEFCGALLYRQSRNRSVSIKQLLLSGHIVVGVGNIYASESLFHARINPKTLAQRIGRTRYDQLAQVILQVLTAAIAHGGSTLRDFVGAQGQAGYFQQSYFVYDRAGQPCRICKAEVRQIRQGQRSTFYCVNCQK